MPRLVAGGFVASDDEVGEAEPGALRAFQFAGPLRLIRHRETVRSIILHPRARDGFSAYYQGRQSCRGVHPGESYQAVKEPAVIGRSNTLFRPGAIICARAVSFPVMCKPEPEQAQAVQPLRRPAGASLRYHQECPALAGHSYAARASGRLEILGTKTGVLGDPAQRRRTHFFAVVKTEGEVRPTRPLQFSMRADLLLERPSESYQTRVNSLGLRRAPDAHAANKTFSGAGTSSPLSIMSART